MSLRLAVVILQLCLLAGGLCAQSSGFSAPGSSSTYSWLDPLRPPARVPDAAYPFARVVPRFPVIPIEQYLARKAAGGARIPSRAPAPVQVQFSNEILPRGPEVLPRQPLAPTPAYSWEGIQQTLYQPPDPDIAAGPEDILLVVNSSIARYTRSGQASNLLTFEQWFAAEYAPVCPDPAACMIFDPSIRYDQLHGRFLLLAMLRNSTTQKSYLLLSVSNGATYSGGWKNWLLDAQLNGSTPTANWADYPRLGFDNSAVFLTANMFSFGGNTFQYAKLRILKKSEVYNPATTTLTWQDLWDLRNEDNTKATTLHPVHLRGRTGVGGATALLINASDVVSADYFTLWRIDNPTSAAPAAVRTTIRGVWRYDYPAAAAQLGSAVTLDTGDSRILKAVLRDGVLFAAQNTRHADEPTTVTYSRIDTASAKATLQARLVNGNFFFPALDVPPALGPGNQLPNKYVAGSTTTAAGALTYGGMQDLKAGEDIYDPGTGATARWGDYSGAAIDPLTGGLWVSGEYAKTRVGVTSRWGTWTGYYGPVTSPYFDDVAPGHYAFPFVNTLRTWGLVAGCTPTTFCPDDTVPRAILALLVIRGVYGDSFAFPAAPYFTDVPATHPYFAYIQKLRELNITAGCTPTTFCPDSLAKRGETAIFLVRAKLKSLHGDAFPFPATPYFTDVPSGDPAFSYVQKMRELGITGGCGPGLFCKDSLILRKDLAVFLVRALLM